MLKPAAMEVKTSGSRFRVAGSESQLLFLLATLTDFSGTQFPHLQNGTLVIAPASEELLHEVDQMIHAKSLA